MKPLDLVQTMRSAEVEQSLGPVEHALPYVDLRASLACTLGQRLASAAHGHPKQHWPEILQKANVRDLGDVLAFRAEAYTRRRIAHTADAEVLLMCWLPGQATLVHDHGKAHARVFIVSGRAKETEFSDTGSGMKQRRVRRLSPGDEFRERPGSIHRVACVGKNPLVSLHFNSPPLDAMHNYDLWAPHP